MSPSWTSSSSSTGASGAATSCATWSVVAGEMSVTSHFSGTRPHGRGAGLWLAAQRRRFLPLLGRLPPDLAGVRLACPPFADPPRVPSVPPLCRVPSPSPPAEVALAGPAEGALFGPAFFA